MLNMNVRYNYHDYARKNLLKKGSLKNSQISQATNFEITQYSNTMWTHNES